MRLPQEFLQSLQGLPGFDKETFVAVHEKEENITSFRINPAKWSIGDKQFAKEGNTIPDANSLFTIHYSLGSPVPWSQYGFYLDERPSLTFDPLFHAGCYYVQEASSMFLEQAFVQLLDLSQPLKVLDVSAAPGGKSTHMQTLLSPQSLLVSNEVIKTRSVVLTDYIIKWGGSNVFVTNNDPKAFQKLPAYFDVVVVDASCSGSGLFRKDAEAINEWSLNNVDLCSRRQQRILADVLPTLKEDGLLVYSTCSYSKEEDEEIMDWLTGEMRMENVPLNVERFEGIVETHSSKTNATGYRFYPDKIKGEGFFLSCFRKKTSDASVKLRAAKPEQVSAKEKSIVQEWVKDDELQFIRLRNGITALPQNLLPDFSVLHPVLNMQYAGVAIGEIFKDKLVPHHALAQSLLLSEKVPATDLPYEEAIKYLQRQDFSIAPQAPGWQVVRYQNHSLGWINALKNRINNYYPKELRILKQNNTAFKK